MKRYRLNIPDIIKKEHAWVAHALQLESLTIDEGFTFYSDTGNGDFNDIPKYWLEEIKEPVVLSAEDYIESLITKKAHSEVTLGFIKNAFSSGLKNGRLERDLELKPVLYAADEVSRYSTAARRSPLDKAIYKLLEALENIPPLEND